MLIPGPRPATRRVATGSGVCLPLAGARCVLRWTAALMIAGSLIALSVSEASPARADLARQRQQWVLSALHAPAAWHVSEGRGVVVAVIDSGVDSSVSDLTGSVMKGPNYSGVDTAASNANWGVHGTWMASLIAGHGHGHSARDGIMGIAPQSRILSIRVITDRSDPAFKRYQREKP